MTGTAKKLAKRLGARLGKTKKDLSNPSRIFGLSVIVNDIKKNWVEVKTITKRISGFHARNFQT
jgi:hypothetical protein